MAIKFVSQEQRVDKVMKMSKARYAVDIQVGDIIKFVMYLNSTSGARNGNYAIEFNMYVNGRLRTRVSQNEVPKLEDIFILTPIN